MGRLAGNILVAAWATASGLLWIPNTRAATSPDLGWAGGTQALGMSAIPPRTSTCLVFCKCDRSAQLRRLISFGLTALAGRGTSRTFSVSGMFPTAGGSCQISTSACGRHKPTCKRPCGPCGAGGEHLPGRYSRHQGMATAPPNSLDGSQDTCGSCALVIDFLHSVNSFLTAPG